MFQLGKAAALHPCQLGSRSPDGRYLPGLCSRSSTPQGRRSRPLPPYGSCTCHSYRALVDTTPPHSRSLRGRCPLQGQKVIFTFCNHTTLYFTHFAYCNCDYKTSEIIIFEMYDRNNGTVYKKANFRHIVNGHFVLTVNSCFHISVIIYFLKVFIYSFRYG